MTFRAFRILPAFLAIFLLMQVFVVAEASAAGRYVVLLRPGADVGSAAQRHGAAPDHVYDNAIRGYAANLSDAALAKVRRDPAVLVVSPDRVISLGKPAQGKPGGGGSGSTSTQAIPSGISRIGAAGVRTDGNSTNDGILATVDVAVVDTGIDPGHPDLRVAGGSNCSSGVSWADGNGHGTHVAGTIGAIDNKVGVVGVAPGVNLWAYRVLNAQGSGTTSSVICGLTRAAGNSAIDVVNLSLGGTGSVSGSCAAPGDAFYAAICALHNKGVTVVVAAGNEHVNASGSTPAAYPEVITVSAWADFNGSTAFGTDPNNPPCRTDVDETLADFSNYGTIVDIAAPGVCIRSTWKGGGYNTISGTSMATPHVAGAAALWRSLHAGATDAEFRTQLDATDTSAADPADLDGTDEGMLSIAGWAWPLA